MYKKRCETIAKVENIPNPFINNATTSAADINSKQRRPQQKRYDLPDEIQAENKTVYDKLTEKFPNKLTYEVYDKLFHDLIWLEEFQTKTAFGKYKFEDKKVEKEENENKITFFLESNDMTEYRPQISIGMYTIIIYYKYNFLLYYFTISFLYPEIR